MVVALSERSCFPTHDEIHNWLPCAAVYNRFFATYVSTDPPLVKWPSWIQTLVPYESAAIRQRQLLPIGSMILIPFDQIEQKFYPLGQRFLLQNWIAVISPISPLCWTFSSGKFTSWNTLSPTRKTLSKDSLLTGFKDFLHHLIDGINTRIPLCIGASTWISCFV